AELGRTRTLVRRHLSIRVDRYDLPSRRQGRRSARSL
ncbi:uncharacterized protein METZ01_LOCUS451543, partial [marine metagenome]